MNKKLTKKKVTKWLYAILGILGTYVLGSIISSCLPQVAQPVVWYVCGSLGMWIGLMQFIIEHLEEEIIEIKEPLTENQVMELEQLKTHNKYINEIKKGEK